MLPEADPWQAARLGCTGMTWTWQYGDQAGAVPELPRPESFSSQSDAESWLGENWRDLLEQGVHQVTLLADGAAVYGPMSLHPA
jgi:hypothetical protein